MKVVYTAAARDDLTDIAGWLAVNYPSIAPAVERRIRLNVSVIGHWPESGAGRGSGLKCGSHRSENIRTGFSIALPATPWKFSAFITWRGNPGTSKRSRMERSEIRGHHSQHSASRHAGYT